MLLPQQTDRVQQAISELDTNGNQITEKQITELGP